MEYLQWRWRLWRARHWEWVAYMNLRQDRGDWHAYDRARKHTEQIRMERPKGQHRHQAGALTAADINDKWGRS